jgi:beta-lactamase superfamily II metal-dependent hydrolase
MKRLIPLLTAFTLLFFGCSSNGISSQNTPETVAKTPASPMTVTFLKVGKADGMILQTENHAIIIDCGEKTDGSKMVDCLNEKGITQIDCMILTHYDQDHIGGAAKVLKNFPVSQVIVADYTEESKEYTNLVEAMATQDLSFTIPTSTMEFTFDDATFTVYPHISDDYKDGFDNNCSLVTKVVHGGNVLLFTGDAMQERLDEMMNLGNCDLLKVPYHGREIANLPEFLDKVTPEIGVISTDEENLSEVTVSELAERNIDTYITCQDGYITAVSDGLTISMSKTGIVKDETTETEEDAEEEQELSEE